MSETFDLSDLKLNLESAAPSSWGNFGYWSHAGQTYAEAASALARLHASTAKLCSGQRLLDLAFGCGDQLRLWQQEFSPSQVTTVNISAIQTDWANKHFPGCGELHCADAVTFLKTQPNASYDTILAVDSAYHFSPWEDFLHEAARVLAPQGRMVMTLLANTQPPNSRQALLSESLRLIGIRPDNLNLAATEKCLMDMGLEIETQDITEAVFAGFLRWWANYREHYAWQWPRSERRRYQLTSLWLQQAIKAGAPRYVLLSASKR